MQSMVNRTLENGGQGERSVPRLRMGYKDSKTSGPHVPFNPSPERAMSGAKRYRDDYDMTSFSQSTQAWKWRVEEEERQRYAQRKLATFDSDLQRQGLEVLACTRNGL